MVDNFLRILLCSSHWTLNMAIARPDNGYHYPDGSDDEDFDEAGTSKQNGSLSLSQTDRYGFMGGDQFTDPEL